MNPSSADGGFRPDGTFVSWPAYRRHTRADPLMPSRAPAHRVRAAPRARWASAWLLEHPEGSGPVAGEIAGHPNDAPGAVEPVSQTAHRPLTRRQNPEYAYPTAIGFPIPTLLQGHLGGALDQRAAGALGEAETVPIEQGLDDHALCALRPGRRLGTTVFVGEVGHTGPVTYPSRKPGTPGWRSSAPSGRLRSGSGSPPWGANPVFRRGCCGPRQGGTRGLAQLRHPDAELVAGDAGSELSPASRSSSAPASGLKARRSGSENGVGSTTS